MNKEDVLKIMLDSINADNRDLCKKAGMSDADAESQIAQSQPSLGFILGNIYDKLNEAGVLAK
jgi:hypothetical protein